MIININGRTTVITGWRLWLITAVGIAATALLFGVLIFVMLGVAITVGAVLLIVVPAALIVGGLIRLFGRQV